MVSTQIGKRLIPRFSQQLVEVVPQILVAILSCYAGGKPVLFPRAAINQTLVSAVCDKFGCPILSLIVWNSWACFTTGFMCLLYSSLQEICNVASGWPPPPNLLRVRFGGGPTATRNFLD